MQHRGMHSVYLRIAFWVNKLLQLIHREKREKWSRPPINFELQGVQKKHLKSLIMFLKFQ